MKCFQEKFDDNCYELTALRWFRDNFVSKEEKSDIIYDYIYDNIVPYDNVRINSGMVIIRNKDSIIPKYLYSYMKSQMFKNQVTKTNFGSAQPQLTIKGLEKFNISYPDKIAQTKIANFLSLLDKKIELQTKKIEDLKLFILTLYEDICN